MFNMWCVGKKKKKTLGIQSVTSYISIYFEFCICMDHLVHPLVIFGFLQSHKEYMKLLLPCMIWHTLAMISQSLPFI